MVSPAKNKFQCWLCDGNGDIYFTQDILGSSKCTEWKGWKKVESNVGNGFSSVSAGYSGMVCAIKNESLYLRTEVTSKKPAGSSWEDCHCNAIKVLIGTRYIVRQTTLGSWYFTRGLIVDGLFDWNPIGLETDETFEEIQEYDDKPSLSHYILDSKDKLYAFTKRNQVAFCDLAKPVLQWTIVIESFTSTFGHTVKIVKWMASKLWREESISSASADRDHSIWCHTTNSSEIWQLVVSTEVGKSTKYNWNKFTIPCKKTDKDIVLVESCKVTVGKLYFILTRGNKFKLVVLSLEGDEDALVTVAYPGVWPCRALATSYLPFIEEEKVCCDDGSCNSCMSFMHPQVKDKKSAMQKDNQIVLQTPEPKRRKMISHEMVSHDMVSHEMVSHSSLLGGVTVKNNLLSEIEQFQTNYDISSLGNKVDFNKYTYNFSLENQVLRYSYPFEK